MPFTIQWLGQGGFLFELGDQRFAVDPYLSNSVFESSDRFNRLFPPPIAPEALHCDLIAATHDHLDHLDPDTLIRATGKAFAGPPSCLAHLEKLGFPSEKLVALGRGDVVRLGGARLMGVPAVHTKDSVGLILEFSGVRIYLTGDSEYDPSVLSPIGAMGIDIFVGCINGRLGNMNAADAARLARELPCRLAIPMHYGLFAENTCDPAEFVAAMEGSGIPVALLRAGEAVEIYDLMKQTV